MSMRVLCKLPLEHTFHSMWNENYIDNFSIIINTSIFKLFKCKDALERIKIQFKKNICSYISFETSQYNFVSGIGHHYETWWPHFWTVCGLLLAFCFCFFSSLLFLPCLACNSLVENSILRNLKSLAAILTPSGSLYWQCSR